MDKNEFKEIVQKAALDFPQEYLDRREILHQVSVQFSKLSTEKSHGIRTPQQDVLLDALFLKANIFACMYTSSESQVYQENNALLKKGRPDFVRQLIGDARLSLEEEQEKFLAQMKFANEFNNKKILDFSFTQAVGTQVGLNRLTELRVEMAMNFHDPDFLDLEIDRKLQM